MKGRLLGCALLVWIGVLIVAWWLPRTQTAFWLYLTGGVALWIGSTYLKVRYGHPVDTLGSARFSGRADVNALAKNSGDLLIGRDTFGRLLRYDGSAHLLTIAPTRSGKGVGTIIPNLLTANRSVICIDPKGENARVTLRQRETFGAVLADPWTVCHQSIHMRSALVLIRQRKTVQSGSVARNLLPNLIRFPKPLTGALRSHCGE